MRNNSIMGLMRAFLIVVLIAVCGPVAARMYQWLDPDTGTTQLSGKPPVWYRGDSGGPRVLVFERGSLVDDTAREVSNSEREQLRQQAFIRAEEDKVAAKEKLLQAKRLKATLDKKQAAADEKKEEDIEENVEPEVAENPQAEDLPGVDDMRALIEEWERLRKEDARKLLEEPTSKGN